jgi:hypothetical protein
MDSTWVKAGEGFANMARLPWVASNGGVDGGYVLYFWADYQEAVELTDDEAADVLAYIAAHTWTHTAE